MNLLWGMLTRRIELTPDGRGAQAVFSVGILFSALGLFLALFTSDTLEHARRKAEDTPVVGKHSPQVCICVDRLGMCVCVCLCTYVSIVVC